MNSTPERLNNWKSPKLLVVAYVLLTAFLFLWYSGEESKLETEGELIWRDLATGPSYPPEKAKIIREQIRRSQEIATIENNKRKESLKKFFWFIPIAPGILVGSIFYLFSSRASFGRTAIVLSIVLLLFGLVVGSFFYL